MRKYALTVFILLVSVHNILCGQDMRINFSVSSLTSNITGISTPYLIITYSNDTSCDYYMPALFRTDDPIPLFSRWYSLPKSEESLKSFRYLFYGERYVVYLNFLYHNSQNFVVLDPDNGEDIVEVQPINDALSLYYKMNGHDQDRHNIPLLFTKPQLSCVQFIQSNPSFVFLKAGDSFEQRIDLSGFREAGIIVRVVLNNDKVLNYVETGREKITALPGKVGSFDYYQRYIDSNSIVIDFTDRNNIRVLELENDQ